MILLATAVIVFGIGYLLFEEFGIREAIHRNAQAGVPIVGRPRTDLSLGRAEAVPGSTVLRADLFVRGEEKGFSSSGFTETRNILFIDPSQTRAHWLLPDNDHVISERSDVKDQTDPRQGRVVATAVLVKPRDDQLDLARGKLFLFDGKGEKTVVVADDVRDMHVAVLNAGEVRILFERNRRLVLTSFDPVSLTKKREQELEVPQLK